MTLLNFIERGLQLGDHGSGHRVAFVRPVQGDRGHGAGDVKNKRGIHDSNLLSIHERSMCIFCANFIGHFERF